MHLGDPPAGGSPKLRGSYFFKPSSKLVSICSFFRSSETVLESLTVSLPSEIFSTGTDSLVTFTRSSCRVTEASPSEMPWSPIFLASSSLIGVRTRRTSSRSTGTSTVSVSVTMFLRSWAWPVATRSLATFSCSSERMISPSSAMSLRGSSTRSVSSARWRPAASRSLVWPAPATPAAVPAATGAPAAASRCSSTWPACLLS